MTTVVSAGERVKLGYGRLINNDYLGDGHDRWRTGAVVSSRVMGKSWAGHLPEKFGEIIEYRVSAEIFAPDNLGTPAAGDRQYAGAFSFGAHTHFQRGGFEFATGADLVITGPQTGLADFQDGLHDILGVAGPSTGTQAAQIANGFHPTVVFEIGRVVALGERTQLRPFIEGRMGAETLIRAGADLTIGRIGGAGELLIRDPSTGQRYRAIQDDTLSGISFILGADIAKVDESIFLPSASYTLSDTRQRVRAGMHWQGENGQSGFYGVTWLGEEYAGQGGGQMVGSIRINLNF